MVKLIFTISIFFALISISFSQIKIQEGFETSDSITLPTGWKVFNNAAYVIDPFTNWTVRDSGVCVPGINCAATSKAHLSKKAIEVSWWSSIDTGGSSHTYSDGWLVTKKIPTVASTDILKFWATGGTPNYSDSIQIWVSFIDSLPGSFTNKLGSIHWPVGSTYGNWTQYTYALTSYIGLPIWIGFRYYMDCSVNGFVVYMDDIFVGNPNSINNLGTGIPVSYALSQNYPNPFNPVTTIKFDLPKSSNVKLIVYNSLGQEVSILLNEMKEAGYYEAKFDASTLSSGVYYYRIEAANFVETKKMVVVK